MHNDNLDDIPMSSSKPYLLRAFYDWIVDNNCTPYMVFNTEFPDVQVPQQYVEDGRIILNVAPVAVKSLLISNDGVQFNARFSSRLMEIYAPIKSVLAVYARENGRGMVFGDEDEDDGGDEPPTPGPGSDISGDTKKSRKGRPNLKVVK